MAKQDTYKMTINLSILNHLGVGLYSNIPAVLSEVVANAWDADAEHVKIDVDPDKKIITIEDDGHGMSISDANNKYLQVGYECRKGTDGKTARLKRIVMGRKGIGKLSLFSIANTVMVYSVKEGKHHGFVMDVEKIKENIKKGKTAYNPEPIDSEGINLNKGTRIVLTNMKRGIRQPTALRRRLARRFSVIGASNRFEVSLNEKPISVEDRDYYKKLQYIWTFGKQGEAVASRAHGIKGTKRLPGVKINGKTEKIDGWIGTTHKAGQTKDDKTKDNINKIVIMVRGKLAQEDILAEFGEGGFYSKYIIGEIHANFLDRDDKEDSATTNRQGIIEDDPRYQPLKGKIEEEIKNVQQKWTEWRNEEGKETAFTFPGIEEWYNELSYDHQRAAKNLLGRINQLTVDDDDDKRHIFISGVLTFESLKYRDLLTKIEDIQLENLEVVKEVFVQFDDLEANAYYQITKDRLTIIDKLKNLVGDDAKERVIQEHLFDHLWLLDPSWERATHTEHMEVSVKRAFDDVYSKLTEEQKNARLDIKYTTSGNKHVIIELKRPGRILNTDDIFQQIRKYHDAVTKALVLHETRADPIEFICIVGKRLKDWIDIPAEMRTRDALRVYNARIVMYDELINNAQKAYRDYTEKKENVSRVYKLITSVTPADTRALRPTN